MTLNRTKLFAAAIVVAGGLAAGIGPVVMNIAGAQDPATGLSSDGQPPASGRASSAKGQPPRETSSGGMGLPPGGGVSAPKGGAGMGPPGAGMPGGGGFDRMMVARSQWEYKFVDLRNDHRDEFENAIRRNGNDGWEYCNSERLRRDNGATQIVLVFKRQAGGGMMGGGEGGFGGGRRGDGGSPGVGGMGGGGTRSGGGGGVGGGGGGGARIGGGPGLGGVPELKTFALKNVTANAAAKSLEETFDGPGRVSRIRVVAIPNSNQIIVFASPADLVTIEKLLANTIDVPSGGKGGAGSGGRSGGSSLGPPADSGGGSLLGGGTKAAESRINVFALKNADAVDLAAMLQKLFDHNAIITTDSRTNSLVVRANEDTLDLIRMLVTRLDTVERSNPTPPRKR